MLSINNKVQLIGYLGANPQIKEISGGKKVASLSLATRENYKNEAGDKVEETQWHSLIAWGKVAEVCERLLSKGSRIVIDGKLCHRDYLDKEGVKRYITEVQILEILLLDKQDK